MENIDDLMRQKFDSDDPGERFEFQEEYWEQAQALLERDEQKRRRWLWLLLGLLLGVGLLTWLLLSPGHGSFLSKNDGENQVSTTKNTANGDKIANEAVQLNTPQNAQNLQNEANNNPSTTLNQSNKTGNPATGLKSNPTETVNKSGLRPDASKAQTKGGKKSGGSLRSKKSRLKFGQYDGSNERMTQRQTELNEALNANKGQSAQSNSGNLQLNTSVAPNGSQTDSQAGASESKTNANSPDNQNADTNNPSTTPISEYLNLQIFNLPTPLFPFELPVRKIAPHKLPTVSKEPIAAQDKTDKNRRLSLGLSLAGSAYVPDPNGQWAGWAVGAYGDYRLNKKWSLTLGAQYRFLPGHGAFSQNPDSTNPAYTEQLRYSFGFERETWKVKTNGLHFLEIPVAARWNQGRWGVEGGAAVGMLLAVQNQIEHTTESSLVAAKTSTEKYVKGDKSLYNNTYVTAFAGASYRLTDRVSMVARGQYRFTPVFKSVASGLENNGLGNFDLGLRVRLY